MSYQTEGAYYGPRNRLTPSLDVAHYKLYPLLTQDFYGERLNVMDAPEESLRSLPNVACVLFSADPVRNPTTEVAIGTNGTIPFLQSEEISGDKDDVIDRVLSELNLNCFDPRLTRYYLDLEILPWKRDTSSINYFQLPVEGMRGDYDVLLPPLVRAAMKPTRNFFVLSGLIAQPELCRDKRPIDWIREQRNYGTLKESDSRLKIRPALSREAALVTLERWRELE